MLIVVVLELGGSGFECFGEEYKFEISLIQVNCTKRVLI